MAALLTAGCSQDDGMNRKPLSGTVTVDGTPIPNGSISFEPLSSGGLGSGAMIQSGKYSIEQKDGLPPGKYRVRITGNDGKQFASSPGTLPGDEDMPAETKELVPAEWNASSDKDIEVTDGGPNQFDFPIKSEK